MATHPAVLPDARIIRRLAVNDTGFVFDPNTGISFSVNETGRALLDWLRDGRPLPDMITQAVSAYQVEPREAERDILEFMDALRQLLR
jgi:hypothetical protein